MFVFNNDNWQQQKSLFLWQKRTQKRNKLKKRSCNKNEAKKKFVSMETNGNRKRKKDKKVSERKCLPWKIIWLKATIDALIAKQKQKEFPFAVCELNLFFFFFFFILLLFSLVSLASLTQRHPTRSFFFISHAMTQRHWIDKWIECLVSFFFTAVTTFPYEKTKKHFFFHYLFACRALCLSSIEAFYLTFNRNNLFSIVVVVVPLHHYFFLARMRSFFVRRVFHVSSKETVRAQQQQRAYTRMWILIWECCIAHSGMIVSQLKRALPPLLCLYYNDFEGIYKKANTHTPTKQSNRPNFVFIAFRRILSMRRQTNKNRHKKASSSEEIANNYIYLLFFA